MLRFCFEFFIVTMLYFLPHYFANEVKLFYEENEEFLDDDEVEELE